MADADKHPFLFIGHRGMAGSAPENTLAGFRAAVRSGLKMVELDVRLSLDREVMVIHDADLGRVAALDRRVDALTRAQLQAVDVGAWFDPAFTGETVPTLTQVFDLLPAEMAVNVEIKTDEHHPADAADGIERQVLACIDRCRPGWDGRPLVSSFNPATLRRLRALSPRQPLAVLSDRARQPDGLGLCREIGATAWNPHHSLVTAQRVAVAHRQGFKVFTFTVNSAAELRRVRNAGVDGVFTDDPSALMSA